MNENVKVDTKKVKYPIVTEALTKIGVKMVPGDPNADIVWWDGNISTEELLNILPYQRINKIPRMDYLCYKCTFFSALNQMKRIYPSLYSFYPTTFLLPSQYSEFQYEHLRMCARVGGATWIVKPRSGCCGNGIRIIQNAHELQDDPNPAVVQLYVSPYLLDGFKFDFRFYVLISTLEPFTVYLYNEGIARFCTRRYARPTRQNLGDKFAHLTNTSVNTTNTSATNDYTQLASVVLKSIGKDKIWPKIENSVALAMLAEYPMIIRSVMNLEVEKKSPKMPRFLYSLRPKFHMNNNVGKSLAPNPLIFLDENTPLHIETNDIKSQESCSAISQTVNDPIVELNETKHETLPPLNPKDMNEPPPITQPDRPTIPPNHKYFHILGIDIMINEQKDPIVLELNDRPSYVVTFDLEAQLKPAMLADAMKLVTVTGKPTGEISYGGFHQILPSRKGNPSASIFKQVLNKGKELIGTTMKRF